MAESLSVLEKLKTLHPKVIDLSLGRVERLVHKLGNPHNKIPPAIHIAGTNGKGSTLAFLEALLNGHGKKVHKFTSPHLISFHERIVLARQNFRKAEPISEQGLVDVLSRVIQANGHDEITFFEITTAAAFLAFAEREADYTLLETGLGGRLDATNIVPNPALTLISSISIDHTQYLGETLKQIAGEKAGIMKRNVPCIASHQDPDVSVILENHAEQNDVPLFMAGRDWDVHEQHGRLIYQDADTLLDLPLPNLLGRHQIENAGLAIASLRQLPNFNLSEDGLEYGLQNAEWPGRLQRLQSPILHENLIEGSEIWLDGGHNIDAARQLAHTMAEWEEKRPRPMHIICAMMENKKAGPFLASFEGLTEFVGTIPIPGQDKCFSALELAKHAQDVELNAAPQAGLIEALQTCRSVATVPNRVLICGSLYLVGYVLEYVKSFERDK